MAERPVQNIRKNLNLPNFRITQKLSAVSEYSVVRKNRITASGDKATKLQDNLQTILDHEGLNTKHMISKAASVTSFVKFHYHHFHKIF